MSEWRQRYKVHPAADVFPMMSDDELDKLGENIKQNGLLAQVIFYEDEDRNEFLLDGRNRMEAMERAGIEFNQHAHATWDDLDPVAYVIAANIHRRHFTKEQQAQLIVAAIKAGEKPGQVGPVSKGGRGKVNETKAKAVAIAKEHGISDRRVKRAIAKVEGKKPKPKKKERIPEHPLVQRREILVQRCEIEDDLKARGVEGVHVSILDAQREMYAKALAELGMAEIAVEMQRLKDRVGELKGITAPRGRAA
jgi:hypothetical protein